MKSFAEMAGESGYRLDSENEVRNWIVELTEKAEHARAAVTALDPDAKGSARQQRRLERAYTVALGAAQGAIMCAHRLQQIPDAMADELYTRTLVTLLPTVQNVHVPIITGG